MKSILKANNTFIKCTRTDVMYENTSMHFIFINDNSLNINVCYYSEIIFEVTYLSLVTSNTNTNVC